MHLSYWEQAAFLGDPHTVVVGGGITGLNAALQTRRRDPNRDVLLIERGAFPAGASTRNAGFACFGSAGEIQVDLTCMTRAEVSALVGQRWRGLQLLRETCGDAALHYEDTGSLELFEDHATFEAVAQDLPALNALVESTIGCACFEVVQTPLQHTSSFPWAIRNTLEGAIHTGAMMARLTQLARDAGVRIVTGIEVQHLATGTVELPGATLHPKHILVATNAFARGLLEVEVTPVRNQVWITHPIPGLPIRGTFHMDQGYVYFRNVGNRLLLGGFRHKFTEAETTDQFGINQELEAHLKAFAAQHLLPGIPHTWDRGWSGILGVGNQKTPVLKQVLPGVFAGVRLGGMGVAIGAELGCRLAELPHS